MSVYPHVWQVCDALETQRGEQRVQTTVRNPLGRGRLAAISLFLVSDSERIFEFSSKHGSPFISPRVLGTPSSPPSCISEIPL